ncbi:MULTISPECIES: MFS transporter [unclassified Streptomyces]|uniref:MFS transporter n=1 Tax=unclassified Streptomyces TaxID=2593676 RepID=UPI000888DA2F|nr:MULTISPECIES: MFS transporter [unclassified Streptomyces]PBC83314.1 fucose permease [Streptomyces sp. 2321.6]SDR43467.1 Fucose permease [Streptomyces sp. KS_16]SEC92151.1 Fucose permease [Streptomyces sp. 2133.1]SEE81078.1 Fucose permease [Streptomyces sp. 2112.3]SNC69392.1 Fucose permease [Streptomyces sp. 2114.4]
MTAPRVPGARLRHGRVSLALSFFVQGAVFALLVTRIPAIQERYGISDGLLPAFLAAVPVLAGVGSFVAEQVVKRIRAGRVLRCVQPVVCLALLAVGSVGSMAQAAVALGVFGLSVGALDASMNMLGVSLQRAYGRSIMLGFHAAYSLGGIAGASLAWAGAHWKLSLALLYGPVVAVLVPLALLVGRWFVDRDRQDPVEGGGGPAPAVAPVAMRVLLPLCLVMACAYIGDSTVSNWSAKYLQDVLGSSEQLATVPYNVYMVTTLLGRAVGDLGVRRFGAVAVVRTGTVVAAGGFAVVAAAPGAWAGMAGFTLLGFGLCVIVPQTFAAAGRYAGEQHGPGASDLAVARLNIFNYVGFLIGSPLVGALGDSWSYRGAMLVPMALVLVTLVYARSFGAPKARYGDRYERPRTADVG